MRSADNDGIKVFLTGDQTLTYEQDLAERTIAIVVLSSVAWDILKHHLPLIVATNYSAVPGSIQAVDWGTSNRRKVKGRNSRKAGFS